MCASDVVGQLERLESLELGECTFPAEFASVLGRLTRLRRLRLERGTAECAAPELLRALATLPLLTRLELVNIDIKVSTARHDYITFTLSAGLAAATDARVSVVEVPQ